MFTVIIHKVTVDLSSDLRNEPPGSQSLTTRDCPAVELRRFIVLNSSVGGFVRYPRECAVQLRSDCEPEDGLQDAVDAHED